MFPRKKQGAVDIVRCAAPIITDQLEDLQKSLEGCVEQGQPMVVFDLLDAPLIDSKGLEFFLDLQDQLERLGGAVKLAAVSPVVRDALAATAVGERFEAFPTVKAAIGSFAQ